MLHFFFFLFVFFFLLFFLLVIGCARSRLRGRCRNIGFLLSIPIQELLCLGAVIILQTKRQRKINVKGKQGKAAQLREIIAVYLSVAIVIKSCHGIIKVA